MDLTEGRVGSWYTTGAAGWTFPVAVVSLIAGGGALIVAAAYLWLGSHVPCNEKGRLLAFFAVALATGTAALPIGAVRSIPARLVFGIVGAAVGVAISWLLLHLAFASHLC